MPRLRTVIEALPGMSRPFVRMAASVIFAVVGYGGWAYFANRGAGPAAAFKAFAVQAAWSGGSTLLTSTIIELVARGLTARRASLKWTPVPALVLVWVGPVTVHSLAGTPQVLRTIAPTLVIGSLYVLGYAAAVVRARPVP